MKLCLAFSCFSSALLAQTINVFEGNIEVTSLKKDNSADSIIVKLPNGSFGSRDASSISSFQILSISNDTIYLENGGFVKLPEDEDSDSTNEIQEFSVSPVSDTLFISGGNWVIIPGITSSQDFGFSSLLGGNGDEISKSIRQTSDGGFIAFGHSIGSAIGDISAETRDGGVDYWILKLDAKGNRMWDNLIGGNDDDWGISFDLTNDGGYILAGYSESHPSDDVSDAHIGNTDIWIVKLDNQGNKLWDQQIGGTNYEFGGYIRQSADGNFIVVGHSNSNNSGDVTDMSNGNYDIWVVTLDPQGNVLTNNLIGGNMDDRATEILQTTDGGYIILGESESSNINDVSDTNNGAKDIWIIKLDNQGTIQWDSLIGGDMDDTPTDVIQTSDGGYIILADSESSDTLDVTHTNKGRTDLWIVKLDPNGHIEWDNLIGGSHYDVGTSIIETTDHGFLVGAHTKSSNSGDVTHSIQGWKDDIWIVKLDTQGTILWNNLIGGQGFDFCSSIVQTNQGSFVITGYSDSSDSGDIQVNNHGQNDFWVVKLDNQGNIKD